MKRLVKNRVNIFDKIAFGISLIPFLTFCTFFTYSFSEKLNVAIEENFGAFDVVLEMVRHFFEYISIFQIVVLCILFLYQIWFVINVIMTKADKRKKKKTHDLGLFVLSSALWVFVLGIVGIFVITIWDFELLVAYMLSLYIEFQPMATLLVLALVLALINIINNVRYILVDGVKKYLKDCESCDYKFTNGEMLVGTFKLFTILLLVVIVTYYMTFMLV
jgi:hypothetical protein